MVFIGPHITIVPQMLITHLTGKRKQAWTETKTHQTSYPIWQFPWRTSTDQGLTKMGKWCRWRATMEHLGLMISHAMALPMHKHKWVLRTWRKGRAFSGLVFPNLGASLTLSLRGRGGLPAIKCTVWRGRPKGPWGGASSGLRISSIYNFEFCVHEKNCKLNGLWSVSLHLAKL